MEKITSVKLNATLKTGSVVWQAGVYNAPVPSELIAEALVRSITRGGLRTVEILKTEAPRPKPVPVLSKPIQRTTSVTQVITSNLREGPIFEKGKKPPVIERKEIVPSTTSSSNSTTSTTVEVKPKVTRKKRKAKTKSKMSKMSKKPVLTARG